MKKCPTCDIPLTFVQYEGLRVMMCADCGGHLLAKDRLDAIQRLNRTPRDELKAAAEAGFKGDTEGRIKCPDCHWPMRKQRLHAVLGHIKMDYCRRCGLVWLDPGELAIAQLAYESSPAFLEASEMKARMEDLESSPERKARFEEALARLPEDEGPLEEGLREAFEEALESMLGQILIGLAPGRLRSKTRP